MPQRRRYQEGDDDSLGVGPPEPPPDPATRIPPIGVPDTYRTPTSATTYPGGFSAREGGSATGVGEITRGPLYYEGDELGPAQWSPDRVLDLQRQLIAADLISPGSRLRLGVMDEVTINGYYKLLASANRYGTNWMAALDRMMGESGVPGGGAAGELMEVDEFGNLIGTGPDAVEQLPTRTTAPEDLRRIFRAASIESLGQGLPEGEIEQMIQAYHQVEIQRQRDAYAAEGTSNNVMATPSPEAFMEDAMLKNPEQRAEMEVENTLGAMEDFMGLVGGWQGGV